MAVSLSKGGNISLSKSSPNLKKIDIGLGWNAPDDVDASVFMLNFKNSQRSDPGSHPSLRHTRDQ